MALTNLGIIFKVCPSPTLTSGKTKKNATWNLCAMSFARAPMRRSRYSKLALPVCEKLDRFFMK
jgi:hypothetical protein